MGLPTPIFWFDARQTNGWDISGGKVTKIPSLVGDRYLTTDQTTGHFTGWQVTGGTYLESDDGILGPAVDFGEVHYGGASAPGLVFDGRSLAEGATASNVLRNIGSVVAVYGSHNSGGYFLGGGKSGAGYLRSGSNPFNSSTYELTWANLNGGSIIHNEFKGGIMRQDGVPNLTDRTGFSGAWQTIVFNASATGVLDAWGVGLNDARQSYGSTYVHGGGQKIAELLIFSDKLTGAQCAKVEAWLNTKWFGFAPRGWNGNAAVSRIHAFRNASAADATLARLGFHAAAGETLTVGALEGGHAAATPPGIDKTGGGALAVDDMAEYDGDVRLKSGTLTFNRRATPASLPGRRLMHFDASDAASLTTVIENGTNFVTAWKGDAESVYKGDQLYLTPASGCARAFVREDAFGAGKPALDLGPFGAASGAFSFTTEGSTTARSFSGIYTIVAVVGAQEGGGHLANNYFNRSSSTPKYNTSLVVTSKQGSYFYLTEGACFIDGVKCDMANGYPDPGYHVVALQVPGFNINTIGRKDGTTSYCGGLRLSELAVYNRVLNETELRDASAYLMDKWFGRAAPGYAPSSAARAPDLRTLEIHDPGTAVDVPDGATVRVGELNATVPFEKRGGGTLQIPTLRDAGDRIVMKGGTVVAGCDADPVSQSEMAPEPAFHLDASDTNRMDVVEEDGGSYVSYWYDAAMRNYAFQTNMAWRPHLRTDAEGMLNSRPVVDFGEGTTSGRYLNFCRDLNAVRAVYMVIGEMESTSSLLGSSRHCPGVGASTGINTMYAFARVSNGNLFNNYDVNSQVWGGSIFTNGVAALYSTRPTKDWQIIEVHTTAGAHASALACDRVGQLSSQTRGGQRLAEVLIYTRPLSARERIATRNYLRAKWLPAQALEELPEDVDGAVLRDDGVVRRVAELDASDGTVEVSGESDLVAKRLTGGNDVVKSGAGTLAVGDLSGFSGTISVQGGVLALTGTGPVDASAGFVEAGRLLHMDATYGVQTVTNDVGAVSVTNWISRHDASWTAAPGVEGRNPSLLAYGAADSGLFAVDMAMGAQQCLRFRKDGELAHVNPIRSVFWVIGSQNGGGFLLGGGTNYTVNGTPYNFHRGLPASDTYGRTNICNASRPFINSSADPAIRSHGRWWKNGVAVSPTATGLSGDWDQISLVFSDASAYTDADGFAYDGRSFLSSSTMHNTLRPVIGNQRLAEVIIYNRVLTDAERLQNEAYLRAKWSIGLHESTVNSASVELASGAVLDCGGTNQYVAAISGAGTVANGTLTAGALVADAEATGCLTVEGTFAVTPSMTVELRNLPEITETTYINLLGAASLAGAENLATAVFTGEAVPNDVKVKLVVRADGTLAVRLSKIRGSIMVIR